MTLHAADRDPSVDPGTDFYRFANGGWIDANPIPPGYGSWGAFEEVDKRNEDILRATLERLAAEPSTELERMLGNAWAAGMDLDAIEAAGLSSIQPLLDLIEAVTTREDVLELLPQLHVEGIGVLWGWHVDVDHDDSTRNLLWLAQGGLGLPDRDAYFDEGDTPEELRRAYVAHVAAQLTNLGTDAEEAARLADGVMDLETRLAEHHLTAADRRDPDKTLNRHDLDALAALAPALGLPAYLGSLGAGAAATVNIEHPEYLATIHGLVEVTDVDVLRAYLRFHVVRSIASALPKRFDDESFDFYGRRIRGQQQQHERPKRVLDAITSDLGEALSQSFVAETFPPEAKDRALAMVAEILEEMRRSLETREWMSPETRARGLEKLATFRVKIGYPDRWREWTGLEMERDRWAGNRLAARRFEVARQLAKLDQPVDRDEWLMPPHLVNAYYHPNLNEIVFPAGILQPPMFDFEADDAVNFGGIGWVIAHEITHGFDDQGRRFDAEGHFRDWWTPEDETQFKERADRLAEQFDGYIAVDDVHVNGRLTLGENIADLGGMALAFRALARVAEGAPDVDGLSPAQRFFLSAATLWRANMSDELARTLAQIDPHSPRHLRVRGPVSNLDAFQGAWGLSDEAPMLRAPEERIEIW